MADAIPQVDILRSEFREDLNILRADQRDALNRHADQDLEEFRGVKESIADLKNAVSEATGAVHLAKWVLGLGVPAIFGALVSHVVRHW